jgi:hypothetical protein
VLLGSLGLLGHGLAALTDIRVIRVTRVIISVTGVIWVIIRVQGFIRVIISVTRVIRGT